MDIATHKRGIKSYSDPHIPRVQTHESASRGEYYHSVELTKEALEEADVVVLTTNHTAFDVGFIQQHARLIVDLRNMVKDENINVYKL